MENAMTEARQKYLEHYAGIMVLNTYLKVALFLISIALLGALGLSFSVFAWAKTQKPLIVRIDDVGRATAVNYSGFAYHPEAPEIRYFLAQFVQFHFSRLLASVDERFGKSLFFLDPALSRAVMDEERRTQSLAAFVREGTEEVDIEIRNIVIQDLRSNPMKASVDFDKIFYPRGDRRETRRERYTGSFEFVVQGSVPISFILVNPLGLTISYFRVDAAFKQ